MLPPYSTFASHWDLDPDVLSLNHGSFGATPIEVQTFRTRLLRRIERDPMAFYLDDMFDLLDRSRIVVGEFVGAKPESLVFGVNTTSLVNAVLRSLEFTEGDEILVLDHAYGACINTLSYVCERSGAKMVVVDVPFPLEEPGEVTAAVLDAVSDRTVLALIDHITSPTALLMPIHDIVIGLQDLGVETLVDGAHAPGMVELDIESIGAAYYVANLHKWVCSPKGAAFMTVREDKREALRPSVLSHGATGSYEKRSKLHLEFDWQGTADPTPILSVGSAIEVVRGLVPGGWDEIREHNRLLARKARDIVGAALGSESPAPDKMFGSMTLLPLPGGLTHRPVWPGRQPLQDALAEKHHIAVPVVSWPKLNSRLIRISAHLYNSEAQYEYLAQALATELG